MRLYLDEDLASPLLVRVLQRVGHQVQTPSDVGMNGESDASQLAHATRGDWVIISRNYGDFEDLHDCVQAVGGQHRGIFMVREEQDRRRNMSPSDIARAIDNLSAAGAPIANEYIVLNAWR